MRHTYKADVTVWVTVDAEPVERGALFTDIFMALYREETISDFDIRDIYEIKIKEVE